MMDATRILMSVRIQAEEEVREAARAIDKRAEHRQRDVHAPERRGSVSKERGSESAAAEIAMGAVAAAMASSLASGLAGGVPKVGAQGTLSLREREEVRQCHG